MFTLDTTTDEIMEAARDQVQVFCKTNIRLTRLGHPTLRELFAMPNRQVSYDSAVFIKMNAWDSCDDDLKTAIEAYLERSC